MMPFTYNSAIKKLQVDGLISLVDINQLNYKDRHLFLKEISRWTTFGMGHLENLRLTETTSSTDSNISIFL
jgi:hypothetical protein